MIMAFDFRVNFLRLQLAGGQACTLVRDLKLFSVISCSETAMVREWSVDQRKFLLKRKLQGATLAVIQQDYAYWWPPHTWHITSAPAPNSTSTLRRLARRWNAHGTLQDRRKKREAGREGAVTVCTPANVDMVSDCLHAVFLNDL